MRIKLFLIITMSVFMLSTCALIGGSMKGEESTSTVMKIPYEMIDEDPKEFVSYLEDVMDYEFNLQVDVMERDDHSIAVKMYREDLNASGEYKDFTFPNYIANLFIEDSEMDAVDIIEEQVGAFDYFIEGQKNGDHSMTFIMHPDEHEQFMGAVKRGFNWII